MFEFEIRCREGSYAIRIGEGSFQAAVARSAADVVVADRYFASALADVEAPVVFVDAVEENKTLTYAERIIVDCFEAGARRGSRLLAVGGGVVQDLATLVASIYMRGLDWSYAPTTMMAMADSCIGGKSSINAGRAKNLVGNIYPPRDITVDPAFIATLDDEEIVAGLSEAVKICFCRNAAAFGGYLDHFERFNADRTAVDALLFHVLETKKWFVEVDEFDMKERRLLNFGHTFGHALESATSFSVNHGVGVAVGMLCALTFAEAESPLDGASERLAAHCQTLLARVPHLGQRLGDVDLDAFERAFRADKKHSADEFHLILPVAGGVQEVAFPITDASISVVLDALTRTLKALPS